MSYVLDMVLVGPSAGPTFTVASVLDLLVALVTGTAVAALHVLTEAVRTAGRLQSSTLIHVCGHKSRSGG